MLLMTEKAATWLMKPHGRYVRWLVTQDKRVPHMFPMVLEHPMAISLLMFR